MKHFLCLWVLAGLLATPFTVHAQIEKLDSLSWEELKPIVSGMQQANEFQAAIPMIQKHLSLSLQETPPALEEIGTQHRFLGKLFMQLGQYDSAIIQIEAAAKVYLQVSDKFHPRYIQTQDMLAEAYQVTGDFSKAVQYQQASIDLAREAFGEQDSLYQNYRHNLAVLYVDLGKYEDALDIMEATVDYALKNHGREDPSYLQRISHLGFIYGQQGKYDKALSMYRESVQIAEKILGKDHPVYISRLEGLGQIYIQMDLHEQAITVFQAVKEGYKKIYGPSAYRLANVLNRIGLVYYETNQYDKAILEYTDARNIFEQHIGTDNVNYAMVLTNIAIVYRETDRLKEAIPLQRQAVDITGTTIGKAHMFYTRQLAVLAGLARRSGDNNLAISQYKEALQNASSALGPEHPENWTYFMGLALTYEQMGNIDSSMYFFQQADQHMLHRVNTQFDLFSEQEQRGLIRSLEEHVGDIHSAVLRHPTNQALLDMALNNQLLTKELTLRNRTRLLAAVQDNADSSLLATFATWRELQSQLARQYSLPPAERSRGIDSLENKVNQLESELASQSSDFKEAVTAVHWQDIQAQLAADEVAIEFAHFLYSDTRSQIDGVVYAAYVIRPDSITPTFQILCKAQDLQNLLDQSSHMPHSELPSPLYASRSKKRGIRPKKDQETQASDKDMYRLLWEPLDSLLKGVNRVYMTTSGLLHRLNLSALSVSEKTVLSDQYEFRQLGNLARLAKPSDPQKLTSSEAWMFGGIQYGTVMSDTFSSAPSMYRGVGPDSWEYLPATLKEVEEAASLLTRSQQIRVFTGEEAQESTLKSLLASSTSPRILHFATHGFFFPKNKRLSLEATQDQNGFQRASHPLMRSGLILAQANAAWTGSQGSSDMEDGILTAYEVSQLSLKETELVVLSACETGLGDIDDNEGVYGLQRAFKIAGAKYILMSLWQVPDEATQELMVSFYQYWLNGSDIHEALHKAQKKIRRKYKNPYYWAGFVLVE
ncbi:MAG: CHAT domain-containing tetratricopeptide repeat protein [Bacteroidota bacterium]